MYLVDLSEARNDLVSEEIRIMERASWPNLKTLSLSIY